MLHQDTSLDHLDVCKRRVPSEMDIDQNDSSSCHTGLEEANDGNVVLGHHTVKNIVLILHVWSVDGDGRELNKLLVQQNEFALLVEDGAAVDGLRVPLGHGSRARLWPVNTLVVHLSEVRTEVLLEGVG